MKMDLDRTGIIALVFCVVAYVGWAHYMKEKYPPRSPAVNTSAEITRGEQAAKTREQSTSLPVPAASPQLSTAAASAESSYPTLSADELTISTETSVYRFNQLLGGIDSITLKHYRNDEDTASLELVASKPLLIQGILSDGQASGMQGFAATRDEGSISFSRQEGNWQLQHRITPDQQGYGASIQLRWKNLASSPQELTSTTLLASTVPYKQKSSGFLPGAPSNRPTIIREVEGETTWQDVQDYCEGGKEAKSPISGSMQELAYIGFDQHYFLQVFLPQHKKSTFRAFSSSQTAGNSCTLAELVSLNQGSIAPGGEVTMEFKSWFGPKNSELAGLYDQRLANSLDFGFFAMIARPLFIALKAVNSLVFNWGLAIIIFTILLKMLFYPLTRQAAVAQQKMKKLQPEINALKERYKDDPRRQQQEMMRFMSVNKANPLKGCLPILPTIPVFFAFFRVLSTAVELRHAPFFGWITDLSVQDPYYITPLFMGLCMFAQQKLMPTPGMDKTQEKILLIMPLMFTGMMLTLPAGLVLYMLTNSIMSMGQQQWLNKRLAATA